MKKAQIVVEYAIISAVTIALIAIVVAVFNLSSFHTGSTFGFKTKDNTVVVPPMTP